MIRTEVQADHDDAVIQLDPVTAARVNLRVARRAKADREALVARLPPNHPRLDGHRQALAEYEKVIAYNEAVLVEHGETEEECA